MSHMMIDFETLATTPDAKVLSLGAVYWGLDRNGEQEFVQREWFFHLKSQTDRFEDPKTVEWWAKQSESARAIFLRPESETVLLSYFCIDFADWCESLCDPKELKIWGNGALFDNAILNHIFESNKTRKPWRYTNEMCYRTIKKCFPQLEQGIKREGVHHNGLDDARFQMECLKRWFQFGCR